MGVLTCDRKGCDNVMCDISVFMGSEKVEKDNLDAWEAYVDQVFKDRSESW